MPDPQVVEAEAAVPPWFAPAMAAALVPLTRTTNIAFNLHCADGRARSFKTVPFVNGDDPTEQRLPPLRNVDDIDGLTGPQATAYLEGYEALVPDMTIDDQKRIIRVKIGCSYFS